MRVVVSLPRWVMYHTQLLYLFIHSVDSGVPVNPTGFTTTSNERLVTWDMYEIKNGFYQAGATTIETCLTACKADTGGCVAYTFYGEAELKCFLHKRMPVTSSTSAGCSSDSEHLVPLNQEGVVHHKILTQCYASLPVTQTALVLSRGDKIPRVEAGSLQDCSVLCQVSPNCAVAEWEALSGQQAICNLFPRLETYPQCRAVMPVTNFSIIAQPCVDLSRVPSYSEVRVGYYSSAFTQQAGLSSFLQCRAHCDADAGCLGFAFSFSYTGGSCRTYATNGVCSGSTVDTDGQSWYTYLKGYACGQFSTTRLMPVTTFPTTGRPTHGPPMVFTDYHLMVGLEVRGGELYSTAQPVDDCRTTCNEITTCRGFNYNQNGRQCYHLGADSICLSPTQHMNSVHYRKRTSSCTWEYRDRSVTGGVYYNFVTDALRCERACRLEYSCTGFDFDPTTIKCYLHFDGNVCGDKNILTGVTHYRLKGHTCPTETEAIVYENSRLVGGRSEGQAESALDCFLHWLAHGDCKAIVYENSRLVGGRSEGQAESALACFSRCMAQGACSGVDYHKANKGCWFLNIDSACTLPETSDCCYHLKVPGFCPSIGSVPRPRQAFVDIKSPVSWDVIFATQQCDDKIKSICAVIQGLSTDRSLASLKYMGTMPVDSKVVVRFETVTTGISQEALLNSRVQEVLKSVPLSSHSATVTFHALPPLMEVESVTPPKGPRAGGTVIVLSGRNLDFARVIRLGQTQCVTTVITPTVILCTTARLDNNVLLDVNQTVTLSTGGPVPVNTGFPFKYVPDPIIISVEPLVTINAGGIFLTVSGISLDTVQAAIMTTKVLTKASGQTQIYNTTCIVDSTAKMRCPTPDLRKSPLSGRKRRRRAPINTVENKDFDLGFILDGVTEYQSLTGALLQFSRLVVYPDPFVESFVGDSITFVTTWPVSDSAIDFKGDRLTDGMQADDIDIRVGEARCVNVKLFAQKIVCEPPSKRPYVRVEDRVSDGRIPVKVMLGNLPFDTGYLRYQQTMWEYPPARWTIIGLVICLVLLIIIIILCCCCCGSDSSRGSSRSRRSNPRFDSAPPSPQRTRTNSSSRYTYDHSNNPSNGYGPYNGEYRSSSRRKDHYRENSLSLDTYRENSHRRDHQRENSQKRDHHRESFHRRGPLRESSKRREYHEDSRHSNLEPRGAHEYNYPYVTNKRPKSYPNPSHRRDEDDPHYNREYHQTLEDLDDDLDDVYGAVNQPSRRNTELAHNGLKAIKVANGVAKGVNNFSAIADLF